VFDSRLLARLESNRDLTFLLIFNGKFSSMDSEMAFVVDFALDGLLADFLGNSDFPDERTVDGLVFGTLTVLGTDDQGITVEIDFEFFGLESSDVDRISEIVLSDLQITEISLGQVAVVDEGIDQVVHLAEGIPAAGNAEWVVEPKRHLDSGSRIENNKLFF